MASGHMNRVKRPDTWLHRPMLQNVKKVLANTEPSTHDPQRRPPPCRDSMLAENGDGNCRASRWHPCRGVSGAWGPGPRKLDRTVHTSVRLKTVHL
jgi:hypothetical protein